MSVYHQMGEKSENLLHHEYLSNYRGAILSPVNYTPEQAEKQVLKARKLKDFDVILDPQLYYPRTMRGRLRKWDYFPADFDTADPTQESWWKRLSRSVGSRAVELQVDAVCSPAIVPSAFSDKYYEWQVSGAKWLSEVTKGTKIRPVQTIIADFNDLAKENRAAEIATIATRTVAETVYLVVHSQIPPRREFNSTDNLKGIMHLISHITGSGLRVIVGFSSSDILLWKFAGAHACSTGKFFNLRRFTKSRFEEESEGGGQLPYWFEESILAFVRESDIVRLEKVGLLSDASKRNPFSVDILERMKAEPTSTWIKLGWLQFMYWFSDIESRFVAGKVDLEVLLREADERWTALDKQSILMEERHNDGSWVRLWRRAVLEFSKETGKG